MNRTTQVPANGQPVQETLGSFKFLRIRKLTSPVLISFDGNDWLTANLNDQFTPKGAQRVYFQSAAGVGITVEFSYGNVSFTAQDTAQSNAQTYALGNLGIATGAGAAGALPACDGNGYLQITNAMALVVPGTNNSHRRQIITFSVAAGSPAPLNLLDANGFAFMTIASGQQIALATDAQFTLSGAGGTAWVTVGQIFLSN